MMVKIHFISGLPRSGSTLLAALLRQNPDFRAGMTSPLYQIFAGTLRNVSGFNEAHMFLSEQQRHDILLGIFQSYFSNGDGCIINFDTSRAWTTKTNQIFDLFPHARMICCVRNISWIVESFERIITRNRFELSRMFGFDPNKNVYSRANQLTAPDGMIGVAFNNLREAYFGMHSDKLMLIRFETLTKNPEHALKSLYSFIGEEWADNVHQYEKVDYQASEFDLQLGTPGLHTVRGPVKPFDYTKPSILPPDIFEAHKEQDFWNNDQAMAKSNAIVV